ncbi:MAG TPA: MFS transporter, partial [Longimicrobiales bacterium]|nr:MFS transporter [Longimicrobiales bacterium]
RYRWVVLVVATVAQAATAFVFLGVGALAGFLQEAFSLSGAQTGLIVTAAGAMPLFALMPVGRLLDRFGERAIVAAGALLLAAGTGAAAFAPSYPVLLLLLLVGGIGYATSQPGGSKAVAGWFTARQRGLAMGIRQTGLPLGGALAAAVLPALAALSGWRPALATAAGATAAGGLAFALLYRSWGGGGGEESYGLVTEVRRLLAEPRMRPVLWAGLAQVSAQFCIISYLMLFLRDVHGIPLVRGAWFLFTAQLLGVAGRVVLASLSDRMAAGLRLRPVTVSLVAAATSAALLPLLPPGTSQSIIFLLAAVLGFFAFGWYGPWVVHVAEVAPTGMVGLTLGLSMTANQLGIVAAPPLFGLILDLTGSYGPAWWAIAVLLLVAATRLVSAARRGLA